MKKIVLTGGGTAGHVTPNIALLPALQAAGYEIAYVGSYEGIEKKLIADFNIPYTGISTGKFRRYLDPKNFSDPFRVMKGFVEARNYLKNYQPDVVFSKGGFVSVPVVRAAASLHIPCIIHESDMTPGLANKLCIPVAEKVCCNFPETMKNIPADKAVLTGSPLRASSRGDQLLNAASFEAQGYSIVLNEDDITTNLLVDKVHELYFNRQNYVEAMSKSHQMDAVKTIMELINAAADKKTN